MQINRIFVVLPLSSLTLGQHSSPLGQPLAIIPYLSPYMSRYCTEASGLIKQCSDALTSEKSEAPDVLLYYHSPQWFVYS